MAYASVGMKFATRRMWRDLRQRVRARLHQPERTILATFYVASPKQYEDFRGIRSTKNDKVSARDHTAMLEIAPGLARWIDSVR
jgi:hypothetical protein